MSLVLVGAHRHYTVRITRKGSLCRIQHHRSGQRTVVQQTGQGHRTSFRDLLR